MMINIFNVHLHLREPKIKVSLHQVSPIIQKMHLMKKIVFDWATYDTNSPKKEKKKKRKFIAQIHDSMHVEVHIEPPRCLGAQFDVPHGKIVII